MTVEPLPFDVVEASRRLWLQRWDPSAASGNAVFTAVLRAQQVLTAQAETVVRAHGLTFGRYQLLAWLDGAPGSALTLSWISRVLRFPPATVTNLIDRLEADGLVRRVPHATDGRTTLAEITEHGRDVARAATEQLNAEVYRPLALDDGDRDLVVGVLARLRAGQGEFDPGRSEEVLERMQASREPSSS